MSNHTYVQRKLLQELYSNAAKGVLGQFLIAITLISALYGVVSNPLLVIWSSVLFLTFAARAFLIITFQKTEKSSNKKLNLKFWTNSYQAAIFTSGLSWGVVVFLFKDQFQLLNMDLLMGMIIFGLAGSSIATLGIIFRIYASFILPMLLMLAASLLLGFSEYHFNNKLAFLTLFNIWYLLTTSHKYSQKSYSLIQKNIEQEKSQINLINKLGKAGEYRDNDTDLHVKRMSYNSFLLAKEVGLSEKRAKQILIASPLHDIGKIAIPDYILLKPGKLNKHEWKIMKTHASLGAKLLKDDNSDLLNLASTIAENHHEKWDGSGYPKGISKEEIPIEARIVTICDVFDALTSERPYKKPWSVKEALEFIQTESNKHFDPFLVKCFISIYPQDVKQ